VVRSAYAPLVREGLAAHDATHRGVHAPLLGVRGSTKSITNPVKALAVTAQAGVSVDVDATRLRSTWLLACMTSAVPLGALLQAAGLRSARTLTDLLPYCPPPDPAAVDAALAYLRTPATTRSRAPQAAAAEVAE
jgi:hypothetical protein